MKKIVLLPAILVCIAIGSAAQSTKKIPPPPPPEPPVIEVVKFAPPVVVPKVKTTDHFLKRNKTVAGYNFRSPKLIILTLRNKTVEKYDLADEKQNKTFTDKYGEAPVPPPPPPVEVRPAQPPKPPKAPAAPAA